MTNPLPLRGQPGPTNGCHNRKPYKDSLLVQDGWDETGDTKVPKFRRIPFTMSRHCNYTSTIQGRADARCNGCNHREASQAQASGALWLSTASL